MTATLGQLIRERRMELNLTQEELAERVGEGVRQSEISRLERNRVTLPRRQRMEQIAAALDIPVGVLLARSGWAGAETIEDSGDGIEGGVTHAAIESFAGEPVAALSSDPEPVADPSDDQTDGELAVAAPWSGLVRDDPAFQGVGESPHLHDAIERAEVLIAESEATMRHVRETIDEARASKRRRQASRTDPSNRMTIPS